MKRNAFELYDILGFSTKKKRAVKDDPDGYYYLKVTEEKPSINHLLPIVQQIRIPSSSLEFKEKVSGKSFPRRYQRKQRLGILNEFEQERTYCHHRIGLQVSRWFQFPPGVLEPSQSGKRRHYRGSTRPLEYRKLLQSESKSSR